MAFQSMLSKGDLGLTHEDKKSFMESFLSKISPRPKKILILPPDFTRFNSAAGELSDIVYELAGGYAQIDLMPALGTHFPMTETEIRKMFGDRIPLKSFLEHDWRKSLQKKGIVEKELIHDWSEGKVSYPVSIEVNKRLFDGYDLILSIGQVVPHEVVGMANYTKNICVGVGGQDTINKSHFLGAAYGMERIMGRTDTPVRKLFDYGVSNFLSELPIQYVLTVVGRNDDGSMAMRGIFGGNERDAFVKAAELSRRHNLTMLDKPIKKCVVYLDPHEFKSTWLGNKSVYRTRMAMADGGELVVLAPGLREFGEDKEIDRLIRKYGYKGTPATLDAVKKNKELSDNLSAAAHLIHGSSEGRFSITYCPGEGMSEKEIRSVGFEYCKFAEITKKYNPDKMKHGFNRMPGGEEIFFIGNPSIGLWTLKEKFC